MSTNISKQKRDDLLHKIQEIRTYISTAEQDDNTACLLSYLSDLAKDVNGKKYGLVFEEHREEIDEVLATHTPVLTEDRDLFIENGGQMNCLIEGDNLASLKLLEKTHKGKIDLIYIDPPYNRGGNDFRYDDNYVEKQDSFRHSKWLSFIKPRIEYAYKLLKNDGVIFISIDDFEIGALRLVCDEVFGESSFVCNIVWQKRYSRENREAIGDAHEYVLVYSKDKVGFKEKRHLVPMSEEQAKIYKNPNNDPKGRWRAVPMTAQGYRPNQMYPIVDPKGGVHYPPEGRCWSTLETEYKKLLAQGRIYFGKNNDSQPNTIRYLSEVEGVVPWTWWNNEDVGHTDEAKKELYAILGKTNSFETPKPVRLIKRILEIASEKDALILDFFAGSGTTGQAVMKMNAEDGGNRRFILCTNNENNICREVTYERIRRVIKKEGYGASLKYYKVDYIPIDERMYYEYADELLLHIRELVELENGINFNGNDEIAIILTDEELAAFTENIGAKCRKLYMGHDILPDEEQQAIIAEHGIEINIIPDYYYRDLQES